MSGTISTIVPSSVIEPGFYFQISGNGNPVFQTNVVILGSITSAAPVNVPTLATSLLAAQTLYGADSMLATNFQRYYAGDSVSTVYLLPCAVTAGVPNVTAALAGLGATLSQIRIVSPWSDSATAIAIDQFLGTVNGRWGFEQELYGFCFMAATYPAATVADVTNPALATSPLSAGSKFISCLVVPDSSADSAALIAMSYASVVIPLNAGDSGLPATGLPLPIAIPLAADVPNFSVRNTFLGLGLSTFKLNPTTGQPMIDKCVTTCVSDELGNPSATYREITTIFQLEQHLISFRNVYSTKLLQKKIVTDDSLAVSGSSFITTDVCLAEFAADYKLQEQAGIVADSASWLKNARIQNAGNGRFVLYDPVTIPTPLNQVVIVCNFSLT